MSDDRTSDLKALKRAWAQLCNSGTASPTIAHHLQVGLKPFLDAFRAHYLGPDNIGEGCKLILGMNGEGKTHLLLCLRELALNCGHAVALLDPKTAAVGDSPFVFAQEILRRVETSEVQEGSADELRVASLLSAAVQRKRDAVSSQGGNPELVLAKWVKGFRSKNLHPFGLADALADGLAAVIDGNEDHLKEAAAKVTFEGVHLTKKQADQDGLRLLASLPLVVGLLGFGSLIILLDEAETAVEKKGNTKRQEFLKFLRFLNDHIGHPTDERASAMVIVGCTDEFWPQQFAEYEALRSRLVDPGKDNWRERSGLTPKKLIRLNKIWVRETFQGTESDYEDLGHALVDLAKRIYPDLENATQMSNVTRFARVASSDRVKPQVKRIFVKALCQDIEAQLTDEQRVVEEKDVRAMLDAAVASIQQGDADEE